MTSRHRGKDVYKRQVYGHTDDGIDRFARVDFRDVSVEGYRLDQLRFVHVL